MFRLYVGRDSEEAVLTIELRSNESERDVVWRVTDVYQTGTYLCRGRLRI